MKYIVEDCLRYKFQFFHLHTIDCFHNLFYPCWIIVFSLLIQTYKQLCIVKNVKFSILWDYINDIKLCGCTVPSQLWFAFLRLCLLAISWPIDLRSVDIRMWIPKKLLQRSTDEKLDYRLKYLHWINLVLFYGWHLFLVHYRNVFSWLPHFCIWVLMYSFQTRNEITITPVAAHPVKAKEEVVLVVRL